MYWTKLVLHNPTVSWAQKRKDTDSDNEKKFPTPNAPHSFSKTGS
jgi:hypothetical protein